MNRNLILGLKSDKITQEILNELNAIQGIKTSKLSHQPHKRFYEISSASIDYEDIEKPFQSSQIHCEDFISLQNLRVSEIKEENPLVFSLNRNQISAKEDEFLQETKRFNELIAKDGNNVDLWLEFIEFQKKMFFYLPNSNKNQQNIIEKQLAIVEKALENEFLKNNSLLILLRIRLLKSANKGEDFFRICDLAWNDYIKKNPENKLFWSLFFDFKFSSFIKFNVKNEFLLNSPLNFHYFSFEFFL